MSLADSVLEGSRLALARLLTQVENGTSQGRTALNQLFPYTGQAHLIGVTGAPGTGKSSLVNQLARYYRRPREGEPSRRVGIVAVDPSSPFTGGAILGDRVRMRDLAGDPDVFIRSMASRGSLGGLASTTAGMVQALDAAGFDLILIETVGAGQAEVEIARLAHTTLVIEAPGLGDDIQAIKAGILEIADIIVVNKADRPGAEVTERALRNALQLAHPGPRVFKNQGSIDWSFTKPGHTVTEREDAPERKEDEPLMWMPPVLKTDALDGKGVAELAAKIQTHLNYLRESGEWERRERARLQSELDQLLRETLVARWRAKVPETEYRQAVQNLVARQISPWQAVENLLDGGVE